MSTVSVHQPDVETAWRGRIRSRVHKTLAEVGLRVEWNTLDAAVREARALGARLLAAEFTGSSDAYRRRVWQAGGAPLGLGYDALERIAGFGAWQANALRQDGGSALVDRDVTHSSALAAAAWFNLGIVLFDALLDHDRDGAALLRGAFSGNSDESTRTGGLQMPGPSAFAALATHVHPGVAFFGCVATCFFSAIRNLDSTARAEVQSLLPKLFDAEMALALQGCSTPPTLAVWRAMRAKSAGPMRLVGQVACSGLHDSSHRQRLSTMAMRFGECLWIVDDLCDALDDWQSGSWNRIWWQLLRSKKTLTWTDSDHAFWALDRSVVVDIEARRLANALLCMRGTSSSSQPDQSNSFEGKTADSNGRAALAAATTVAAWVG